MSYLCRLCLSAGVDLVYNLYENSELMAKISTCLQVEILQEESLPNQICITCNNSINEMYSFIKTVVKNQNTLNKKLLSGKESIKAFYSLLRDVKNETKDVIIDEPKLEENVDMEYFSQCTLVQKKEHDNSNLENQTGYSSDDNTMLLSLKEGKTNGKSEKPVDETKKLQKDTLNLTKTQVNHSSLTNHYKNKHKSVLTQNVISYSESENNRGNKIYRCNVCEKNFRTKKAVRNHIQYKHQDIRPYDNSNLDDNIGFNSDDNTTLLSFKEEKTNDISEGFNSEDNTTLLSLKEEKTDDISEKTVDESKKLQKDSTKTEDKPCCNISEYKCLMCLEVFDNRSLLSNHYKNKHKPVLIKNEKINYSEVENDKGNKNYRCNVCEKDFRTKKSARSHIQYKHQEIRPYVCRLCGRTYKAICEIILHLRAHNGTKMFCSHGCGYSTVYIYGLRAHEKQHKGEYKYKCEKCAKGFDVRTWFEDHMNEHTGAKPYVCDTCEAKYHCKRHLVRHQTTAHPATLPCEKPRYVCTQCSLPCDTKLALQTHLSKEHGIKHSFLCDVCGKSFKRSVHLQLHKIRHLGVKNHTCSQCNKLFSSSSSLRRHEWTHIGFKKYSCADCGKRYTHKAALVKHQFRYHTASTAVPQKNRRNPNKR